MVSHTREKLIEVARQLFAYKGVENTTMSDIATASEKAGEQSILILRVNVKYMKQLSSVIVKKLSSN